MKKENNNIERRKYIFKKEGELFRKIKKCKNWPQVFIKTSFKDHSLLIFFLYVFSYFL